MNSATSVTQSMRKQFRVYNNKKPQDGGRKMDSRIGLDYIVENKDYTTKLAAGQRCLINICLYDSVMYNDISSLRVLNI